MDFSTLDTSATAEDGAVMQVRHPATDEALEGVTITLRGTDSQTFRQMVRQRAREQMNARKKTMGLDEAEEKAIDTLVNCTVTWSGVVEDGKTLKSTPENVRMMYKKYVWLKEQVDEFMADRVNFMPSA